MLKLGVNIDHVATLRQARGTDYPDLLRAARLCEEAGAHGITIHLREDRRHIQDADVYALRESLTTRMNLEMANAQEIVQIALRVQPEEVCLVPEKREELTTEGGLDAVGLFSELEPTVKALADAGILVSLFIEAEEKQISAAASLGVAYIELHTGTYCNAAGEAAEKELQKLVEGARMAHDAGIKVNAGHGLNLKNIEKVLTVPYMDTLNIGHSIIADSVFTGLKGAVEAMMTKLSGYSGGDA